MQPQGQMIAPQHIPIPEHSPVQQYPFTMSVPSSTSSTYSSLPQASSGYFNVSPQVNKSFGSMSASGRSTPNTSFSPAISTPGMGTSASGTSEGTPAMWAMEAHSSSSVLEMGTKGKKSTRGKHKAGHAHRSGTSQIDVPTLAPVPAEAKRGHKSAKRRKSEPQPGEFRDVKPPLLPDHKQVGLGVMMDGGVIWEAAPTTSTDQPKYRRTHSEGANAPLGAGENSASATNTDTSQTRSPTPPFLSPTTGGGSGSEYWMHGQSQPGQAGLFFATTVIVALSMSGLTETLNAQLGMSSDELEEIRGELAGVYERWRLEKGLRGVTIAPSPVIGDVGPHASTMMVSVPSMTSISTSDDQEVSGADLMMLGVVVEDEGVKLIPPQ